MKPIAQTIAQTIALATVVFAVSTTSSATSLYRYTPMKIPHIACEIQDKECIRTQAQRQKQAEKAWCANEYARMAKIGVRSAFVDVVCKSLRSVPPIPTRAERADQWRVQIQQARERLAELQQRNHPTSAEATRQWRAQIQQAREWIAQLQRNNTRH